MAKPRRDFFAWMRPAFAVPVFAALLLVIGYQNLATIPGLRTAASEPRVLPWTPLHAGTRGGAATPVIADRRQGAVVLIDLPDGRAYASYALNLYDPQGKQVWAQSIPASLASSTLSVLIPGAGLQQGAYALAVSGVDPGGTQTEIDRRMMEIHFSD